MIKAFLIDDEYPALQELQYLLESYPEIQVAGLFDNPLEAWEKIEQEKPDVVFLDIDLPYMNGIELGVKIQAQRYGTFIVFVTAYSEYALKAFQAYPLDFILKPIDEERFQQTMEHFLEQYRLIQEKKQRDTSIYIRCFGKLEISRKDYQDREDEGRNVLKLPGRNVKELLAYLITRSGKPVSRKELISVLFDGVEDKKTVNHLHVTVYNLRKTLESFGVHRQYITLQEDYTLEIAPGVCDYVDLVNFLQQNPILDEDNYKEAQRLLQLYQGAFLEEEDYIWAVEVRAWAEQMVEDLTLKLAEYYETTGEFIKAEQNLLALLGNNPLSEQGHHFLMDLYLARNFRIKFVRHYEKYRKIWKEELRISPEERYTRLYKKISDLLEGSDDPSSSH